MYIPGINPYLVHIGLISVRWYGFLMALSMAIGIYYFVRDGVRRGVDEDTLYNIGLVTILGGIIGARLVFVATNPGFFAQHPAEIIRIDHGGLAWHGGLAGGLLAGGALAWRKRIPASMLMDLTVPGLAVGYILVRIGNIFNQEVLGWPAGVLGGSRQPAQLYGSAIGLILLLLHLQRARKRPPDGTLFWGFFFWYSILRFIEEAFRENPLYAVGYVNAYWGVGFFTLEQLFTPLLLAIAAAGWFWTAQRGQRWAPLGPAEPAATPSPSRAGDEPDASPGDEGEPRG